MDRNQTIPSFYDQHRCAASMNKEKSRNMATIRTTEKATEKQGVSRRQFMKRTAGIAGLALASAACVPAGPETSGSGGMAAPSQEPTTIQIWWRINPTTQGVIQVFEEQHRTSRFRLAISAKRSTARPNMSPRSLPAKAQMSHTRIAIPSASSPLATSTVPSRI